MIFIGKPSRDFIGFCAIRICRPNCHLIMGRNTFWLLVAVLLLLLATVLPYLVHQLQNKTSLSLKQEIISIQQDNPNWTTRLLHLNIRTLSSHQDISTCSSGHLYMFNRPFPGNFDNSYSCFYIVLLRYFQNVSSFYWKTCIRYAITFEFAD